jgi:hypothetical protein
MPKYVALLQTRPVLQTENYKRTKETVQQRISVREEDPYRQLFKIRRTGSPIMQRKRTRI